VGSRRWEPHRQIPTFKATMDETYRPDHHTPTWMLHGRCRTLSPSEFFPSDGVGVERARRICADCAVKTECLEYALTYRIDHGVWGGCSERERRRILRQRRLTVAPS
jgi:WhiB family transcriptional regulator, redox-sensing transcriptional regulator